MNPSICGCCNIFKLAKIWTIIDIISNILLLLCSIGGIIFYFASDFFGEGAIADEIFIGCMIYSILNIIFLNLTLYGVLKKNSCLNIFSCIIYCLQIFQYIGLIIIQLTFIILYIQKSEILQDEEKPLFYYMNLYYFIIPYQYKITFW